MVGTPHKQRDNAPPKHGVSLWSVTLAFFILATIGVALIFVLTGWESAEDAAPNARRNLELVKVCLQVLGVGAFGAIVSMLAGAIERSRQRQVTDRQEHAEDFELRRQLLDRSTRCAHAMYVTCQHVAREMKDAAELPTTRRSARQRAEKERAAREFLDQRYLEFATEALAIQSEIGARFEATPGPVEADTSADGSAGEVWWRWHQIYDLVTVYYFSLTRNFRSSAHILTNNSVGRPLTLPDGQTYVHAHHSGLDLLKEFGGTRPTAADGFDHDAGESAIRKAHDAALPQFARSLLTEPLRTTHGTH